MLFHNQKSVANTAFHKLTIEKWSCIAIVKIKRDQTLTQETGAGNVYQRKKRRGRQNLAGFRRPPSISDQGTGQSHEDILSTAIASMRSRFLLAALSRPTSAQKKNVLIGANQSARSSLRLNADRLSILTYRAIQHPKNNWL